MKFTTPCFVRVEDAQKQKELTGWLQSIGRKCMAAPSVENGCYYLVAHEHPDLMWIGFEGNSTVRKFEKDFYNCGSNIELFKALAAMNDENDWEQWFVKDCGCYGLGWVLCRTERIYNHFGDEFDCIGRANWAWEDFRKYRRATTEEIIEHFKNKKK